MTKLSTLLFTVIVFVWLAGDRQAHAQALPATSAGTLPLDSGYRQMYNLDFNGAHATFQHWEQNHPDDAMGPVSDAVAYLFSEFDRLHVLEVDLFTDNQRFEKREKPVVDPAIRKAFDTQLSKADQLAGQTLRRSPGDANAMFAQVLANGLRGDYLALVEKRNLAGMSYMKTGRGLAEKLLAAHPGYYDAYLAIGVENYLLGINSAPVRWLLRIRGAQTDKDEGLIKLRLTAEKGHYLAPFARLLLAVAALRDNDHATAKTILASLSLEFPANRLYQQELSRLQ
jgi:hypothetical protein